MPFIRIRYNTKAHEGKNSPRKWRVIIETRSGKFRQVLVDDVEIFCFAVFTRTDTMPVVGRKYHIACNGRLRIEERSKKRIAVIKGIKIKGA